MPHPPRHCRRRGAVLLAVVLAAIGLVGCAQDLHEASWPDLVTARQQDALDRGWVPEWLPEAATDVAKVNRPTTGEVVVRATLPADEQVDDCVPTDDDAAPPDLVDWWRPPTDDPRLACEIGCPTPPEDGPCEESWWAIRADGQIWAWQTATLDQE